MKLFPHTWADLKNEQKTELLPALQEVIAKLHDADILHGDLYDRNIMIDADNNVKLIDFEDSYLRSELLPKIQRDLVAQWDVSHKFCINNIESGKELIDKMFESEKSLCMLQPF